MEHESSAYQERQPLGRRRILGLGSALALGALVPGADAAFARTPRAARSAPRKLVATRRSTAHQQEALQALGRESLRSPGSRPFPDRAAGTDTLQGVDHIVVLVLENHSYDNVLGMLGRGDGFALDANGKPTDANPYGDGRMQRAFRMQTSCQTGSVTQSWVGSHQQYHDGKMDGFVTTTWPVAGGNTPESMGYFDEGHLPFTYRLARQFPIGDRWFCSMLGMTSPNRRFAVGATAGGMTDDPSTDLSNLQNLALAAPIGPTIFNRLDDHGISWADYYVDFPLGATPMEFPWADTITEMIHRKPWAQFFSDAAAGTLPSFVFLDEAMNQSQTEEEVDQHPPFFMGYGDDLLCQVVDALASSPQWLSTMLVITYDEHGGYYDHVPPPVALAPDGYAPLVSKGTSSYDGYTRYGMRVPSIVVSPYAKKNHVSHVLYDHTSILAMIERKWNLPALTYRDANAHDLTDFLDLDALAARRPTFPTLPPLAAPGATAEDKECMTTGTGVVPPLDSISGGPVGVIRYGIRDTTAWPQPGTVPAAAFGGPHQGPQGRFVDPALVRKSMQVAVSQQHGGDGSTYWVVLAADGYPYFQVRPSAAAPDTYLGFQRLWPLPTGMGAQRVAVAAMPDGTAQIAVVAQGNALYHTIYYPKTDTFQSWGSLGYSGLDIGIAAMPNGDSQVITIGVDTKARHNVRYVNGNWQSQGFAVPASGNPYASPVSRTAIAVDPLNGDAHVFCALGFCALGTPAVNGAFHQVRYAATQEWGSVHGPNSWEQVGRAPSGTFPPIASMAAAVPADQVPQLVLLDTGGNLLHQRCNPADRTWDDVASAPGFPRAWTASITACMDASGSFNSTAVYAVDR
ncbi:alkaline phosphatase family protein [Streptomyces puniciscabiei]